MKGILFSEILFNKTINKGKTQTRRSGSLKAINDNPDDYFVIGQIGEGMNQSVFRAHKGPKDFAGQTLKPRYNVGDICYLKEPYAYLNNQIHYKYDRSNYQSQGINKWANKLFMPEFVARYYIKITDVSVERLQDISEEDCLKEGVFRAKTGKYQDYGYVNKKLDPIGLLDALLEFSLSPRESFFSLFRFANKVPKSKEIGNPWVWCYSYRLCDKLGNDL